MTTTNNSAHVHHIRTTPFVDLEPIYKCHNLPVLPLEYIECGNSWARAAASCWGWDYWDAGESYFSAARAFESVTESDLRELGEAVAQVLWADVLKSAAESRAAGIDAWEADNRERSLSTPHS